MKEQEIHRNEISEPGCVNSLLICIVLLVFIGSLVAYPTLSYFAFFESENSTSDKVTLIMLSGVALVLNLFSIKAMTFINDGGIPQITASIKHKKSTALVRWKYSQQEWLIFFKAQHKIVLRNSILFLIGYLLIWSIIYYANDYNDIALLIFFLISFYIILVYIIFAYKTQIKKWKDILTSTQRTIAIYRDAIVIDDAYTIPISGHYIRVLNVEIETKNSASYIVFTVNVVAGKNPEYNIHKKRFLIPKGAMEQAKKILPEFTIYKRL